jgi:hypothetical protein
VLRFERQVVEALSTTRDPEALAAVAEWVDGSLSSMPELLRAGVALASVALGAWSRVAGKSGVALIESLEESPLPPVRMHLRLLRSLVLFGDLELDREAAR